VTWAATVASVIILAFGPQQIETENIRSGADFEAWYLAQPRVPFPVSHSGPGVLVAEFIDYQCPDCRARDAGYQRLFRDLRSRHGNSLRVVRYDFPLERECNQSPRMRDVHTAACEAAAAVRMAREHGKHTAMQDWLWKNQDRLSRELIFQHLRDVVGVDDPAARYGTVLPNVTADAAVGAALSIKSTPTLWVNGVLLSAVSERSLRWAIDHELQQVQLTRATASRP
jgi:protein-disulfide isomerase